VIPGECFGDLESGQEGDAKQEDDEGEEEEVDQRVLSLEFSHLSGVPLCLKVDLLESVFLPRV